MPVSRYTEDELRRAVLDSRTIREVLLRLNLRGAGSNYEVVRRNIRRLDIDTSHFSYTRGQRHLPPETLVAAVAAAKSYRSAVRSLGYAGTPSETRWLQRQVTAAGWTRAISPGRGGGEGGSSNPRCRSRATFDAVHWRRRTRFDGDSCARGCCPGAAP